MDIQCHTDRQRRRETKREGRGKEEGERDKMLAREKGKERFTANLHKCKTKYKANQNIAYRRTPLKKISKTKTQKCVKNFWGIKLGFVIIKIWPYFVESRRFYISWVLFTRKWR